MNAIRQHREMIDEILNNYALAGRPINYYDYMLRLYRCNWKMLEYELWGSRLLLKMKLETDMVFRGN